MHTYTHTLPFLCYFCNFYIYYIVQMPRWHKTRQTQGGGSAPIHCVCATTIEQQHVRPNWKYVMMIACPIGVQQVLRGDPTCSAGCQLRITQGSWRKIIVCVSQCPEPWEQAIAQFVKFVKSDRIVALLLSRFKCGWPLCFVATLQFAPVLVFAAIHFAFCFQMVLHHGLNRF